MLGTRSMNRTNYEAMARMASQPLHEAFVDNATKDNYLLPEELCDILLNSLRSMVLRTDDPLKDRLLDLYVYCLGQVEKTAGFTLYGSSQWINIRTAVKNFLLHVARFDLEAWEKTELNVPKQAVHALRVPRRNPHRMTASVGSGDKMLFLEQKDNWAFIPGPEIVSKPTWSTDSHETLLELKPDVVAAGILAIPNTTLKTPNKPTWWDWSVTWQDQDVYIGVNMTLMGGDDDIWGGDDDIWGGSVIECACSMRQFIDFWRELHRISPRIYVHSPECRVFTPEEFEKEIKE